MDHEASPSDRVSNKVAIAGRLRLVRAEIFGEHGGPELAGRLGLPSRTWVNYESGVTVPGEVLLKFVVVTGAEPLWLLRGEGPIYRVTPLETVADASPG
jgi:hypothetical protein